MGNILLRRLLVTSGLLAVLFLLVACREGCYIGIEQQENGIPVFHLKNNPQAADEGVAISGFVVLRKVDKRYQPVWEIATADISKPVIVKSISYGIVPPGFEKTTRALPLVDGDTYDVIASRPGMAGGEVFVFRGNSRQPPATDSK